jgi:hypothetical protein
MHMSISSPMFKGSRHRANNFAEKPNNSFVQHLTNMKKDNAFVQQMILSSIHDGIIRNYCDFVCTP